MIGGNRTRQLISDRARRLTSYRARRLAGDESGATLILVLLLVTVVSLVIGATLTLADTSIRTTVVVRGQAAGVYDAQGGVDTAINTLRNNSYNNDTSSSTYPKCFGSTATSDTLVLPNFYPGTTGGAASSVAVTCSPDPSTGAAGGLVQINSGNKPGNAILTLGTDSGEDGLNVKTLNNSIPFLVHGGVVSDSNIRVTNGSLQSNTTVFAHTGCSGTIVSNPPPAVCNSGVAADPNYAFDPSFASPANTVPTYRAAPAATSANCPGKLVTFQPGYYDDAAGLNSLMNGVGSNPCKGSVWWFQPGTYYFDFHNTSNPLLSGSDLWTVADGQLVAGTPTNSSGAVISKPTVPAAVPGACQNPIKSDTAVGVQFIFGGDSQLTVSGTADAEICGSYHAGRPPIAIYGMKSGSETPVAAAVTKLNSVPTTDANFGATASVTNLVDSDALSASWTKAGTSNQTGAFTVSGFAPAATAPAGSVLNSASLTVKYQNTAGAAADTRTVVLTPRSAAGVAGTPITVTLPSTSGAGIQTVNVDLFSSGTGALATAFHSLGFSGASAAYSIQTKHAGTEKVDTIQLSLGYTPPAFRGETTAAVPGNCLTKTYTGGSSGQCAVLATSSAYKGSAYVQGTTYTPAAVIDLTLSNITAQVLRFGVVARSLWIKETGSTSYIGPVIEIPDNSPGFGPGGTVVYLNAYVCEAAATCSAATGRLGLRARVFVFDPTGTPTPSSREITVQSWAMQR
ncbi:MAG: hypothetical protein ACJ74U_06315 [Jatrophihabitantaceae bacterium]